MCTAVIPSEVARAFSFPAYLRARDAVEGPLFDVTSATLINNGVIPNQSAPFCGLCEGSAVLLRRSTIHRARRTYLATCSPSASRKQAPHVECGSLLPLSAAGACPGVLLASTYTRRRRKPPRKPTGGKSPHSTRNHAYLYVTFDRSTSSLCPVMSTTASNAEPLSGFAAIVSRTAASTLSMASAFGER